MTLQKLRELERRYNGPIQREELNSVLGRVIPNVQRAQNHLEFCEKQLSRAITNLALWERDNAAGAHINMSEDDYAERDQRLRDAVACCRRIVNGARAHLVQVTPAEILAAE